MNPVNIDRLVGIIKKSGSWFSYEGERLAQGKDNARKVFESNQELMDELEAKVRAMADKLVDNNEEFELDDDDDIDAFELETAMPSHQEAIKLVLDALLDADHGVISSLSEIISKQRKIASL